MKQDRVVYLCLLAMTTTLQGCLLQQSQQSSSSVLKNSTASAGSRRKKDSRGTLGSGSDSGDDGSDPGTSSSSNGRTGSGDGDDTVVPSADLRSPCIGDDGSILCQIKNIGPDDFGVDTEGLRKATSSGRLVKISIGAAELDGYDLLTLRRWGPFDSPDQFNKQQEHITAIFSDCNKEAVDVKLGAPGKNDLPVEYYRHASLSEGQVSKEIFDGAPFPGIPTTGHEIVPNKYYVYSFCVGKINPANINKLWRPVHTHVILATDFVNPPPITGQITSLTHTRKAFGNGGDAVGACYTQAKKSMHNVSFEVSLAGGADPSLPDLSGVPESQIASNPPILVHYFIKPKGDSAHFVTDSDTSPALLDTGLTSDFFAYVQLGTAEIKRIMNDLRTTGHSTVPFSTQPTDVLADPDRPGKTNPQPQIANTQDMSYSRQKLLRGSELTVEVQFTIRDRSLEFKYKDADAGKIVFSSPIAQAVQGLTLTSNTAYPGYRKVRFEKDERSHNQCGICTVLKDNVSDTDDHRKKESLCQSF